MSNDKYPDNFLDAKTFSHFFGRHFWLVDCCKMDEVTLPKLYHLDSWSFTLSDSKTVLVLALATSKIKTLIFREVKNRKIRFISFVLWCVVNQHFPQAYCSNVNGFCSTHVRNIRNRSHIRVCSIHSQVCRRMHSRHLLPLGPKHENFKADAADHI